MYKLTYHVPETHLEATKAALFEAGAGAMGDYDQCCWQVRGEGQFRPLEGSAPYAGTAGELTRLAEFRVEMVCADESLDAALASLRQAHPYETPSVAVWRIEDI